MIRITVNTLEEATKTVDTFRKNNINDYEITVKENTTTENSDVATKNKFRVTRYRKQMKKIICF